MEWYGWLAFLFMASILAGFVWLGANTDKLGDGSFGKPSYISKQFTPPSNDLPPFSFPSIDFGTRTSILDIDIEELQAEIEKKILGAQRQQELDDIVKDIISEPFKDPRASAECKQVFKDFKIEQQKMEAWVVAGNDYRAYPQKNLDKVIEISKMVVLCDAAYQEGLIDNPMP